MHASDLFTLLAIILLGAAAVVAGIHRGWVAMLVCSAGVCLLLSGVPLIHA